MYIDESNRAGRREGYLKKIKLLLYEPDMIWGRELAVRLKEQRICISEEQGLELLWSRETDFQGILLNETELESMLYWGEFAEDYQENRRESLKQLSERAVKSLCQYSKVPVCILMERMDSEREYAYLKMGASECVNKEQPVKLIAERVSRMIRNMAERQEHTLDFCHVFLDCHEKKLISGNDILFFSEKEYEVLLQLFLRKGDPVSRQELTEKVWGVKGQAGSRVLDAIVRQLRKKLQCCEIGIGNCYGRGYYLLSDILKR